MKTSQINKFLQFASVTMAIALFTAITAATSSAETPTGKGGATLLMKPQAATVKSEQQTMSCAMCKDEYTTRKDTSDRGINKPTVLVARHLCGSCDTTIVTAGEGKGKHAVAIHQCNAGGMENLTCCNTRP